MRGGAWIEIYGITLKLAKIHVESGFGMRFAWGFRMLVLAF